MMNNEKPLVTICIPHWQVKEMIALCLRSIRKHTRSIPIEVLVVDNGSQDDSLDHLRRLKWIQLIERGSSTPDFWVKAFITALDLGFERCRSEYYMIMHSDTIIKQEGWLERMLRPFQDDPLCAASGAWKLEPPRPVYEFVKKITDTKKARLWLRRNLLGQAKARQLPRELCPRDYCALYRSEPIRKNNLIFFEQEKYRGYTTAERMYYQLKEHGYHAHVIETMEMMQYMEHLAHGTAALRPGDRHLNHRRTQKKGERRLYRLFDMPFIKELAEDISLDQ
jgi:glycosyltransferase involved in cell wall biosynthesis